MTKLREPPRFFVLLEKWDIDEMAPVPDPSLLEGPAWDIRRFRDKQESRIALRRSMMLRDQDIDESVFAHALEMERHADLYKRARAFLRDPRFAKIKENWSSIHAEESAVYRAWQTKRMTCTLCGVRAINYARGNDACEECHLTRPSTPPASGISSALARARRAKLPATLTKEQWRQTVEHFNDRCAYCGGPWCLVEHATPIPGGGTTIDNCLPACARCNIQKGARTIEKLKPTDRVVKALAWLRSYGRPFPEAFPEASLPERSERSSSCERARGFDFAFHVRSISRRFHGRRTRVHAASR